jgi:hypothetical protein
MLMLLMIEVFELWKEMSLGREGRMRGVAR